MRAFVFFFVCLFYSTGLYFYAFFFVDCLLLSSRIFVRTCTTFLSCFFFVLLALSYRVLSDFWYSSTRMQVFLFCFVWKNRINSHIKSKSVRPYECYWPIQLRAYVNVHDTRSLLNK